MATLPMWNPHGNMSKYQFGWRLTDGKTIAFISYLWTSWSYLATTRKNSELMDLAWPSTALLMSLETMVGLRMPGTWGGVPNADEPTSPPSSFSDLQKGRESGHMEERRLATLLFKVIIDMGELQQRSQAQSRLEQIFLRVRKLYEKSGFLLLPQEATGNISCHTTCVFINPSVLISVSLSFFHSWCGYNSGMGRSPISWSQL